MKQKKGEEEKTKESEKRNKGKIVSPQVMPALCV